jgi:hypothetical protein
MCEPSSKTVIAACVTCALPCCTTLRASGIVSQKSQCCWWDQWQQGPSPADRPDHSLEPYFQSKLSKKFVLLPTSTLAISRNSGKSIVPFSFCGQHPESVCVYTDRVHRQHANTPTTRIGGSYTVGILQQYAAMARHTMLLLITCYSLTR